MVNPEFERERSEAVVEPIAEQRASTEHKPRTRAKAKRRWNLRTPALVLAAAVGAAGIIGLILTSNPDYEAIAKKYDIPTKYEQLDRTPKVDTSLDASRYYAELARLGLSFNKARSNIEWKKREGWTPVRQGERERLLDANKDFLELVSMVAALPYASMPIENGRDPFAPRTDLDGYRSASYALCIQSRSDLEQGKPLEAVADLRKIVQLTKQLRYHDGEPDQLRINGMDSALLDQIASELVILSKQPEASAELRRLLDEMVLPNAESRLRGAAFETFLTASRPLQIQTYAPGKERFVAEDMVEDVEKANRTRNLWGPRILELAGKQYLEAKVAHEDVQNLRRTARELDASQGIVSNLLLNMGPVGLLNDPGVLFGRLRVERKLVLLALDALAKGELPRVAGTVDDFSGGPLKLRKTERGWVIYSVGQDGVDNGGIPSQDKTPDDILLAYDGDRIVLEGK